MAEFVAMPLWTDAYLGDTTHLSTIEHGAYLLLLITEWRSKNGTLPDDDVLLAKYSKLTPLQWKKIRPILAPFFRIENGFWIQGRLHDELDAVRRKSKRQSNKAKVRWLNKKKTSMPQHSPGNAATMPPIPVTHTQVLSKDNTPIPPTVSHETKPQASKDAFEKFWSQYPGMPKPKGNKNMAWIKFKKTVNQGVKENDLIESAGNYRKFCDATGSFNQHAATWLNQRGFENDWLEQSRSSSGAPAHHHRGANGGGQSVSEISVALKAKILAGDSASPERSVTDLAREPEGAGSNSGPSGVLLEVPALVWEET